ncbi:hypothetical protein PHMEG_00010561 [Phytophthora megakarya]|uniref:Bzip transcription factor n=1 Tax=Phytophthora megakarya TaxID=4795 RepID=A0A225WEE8_9STRA|nr:hypothetical protein PHMEG_00010561 [Phytophthora megakarya]
MILQSNRDCRRRIQTRYQNKKKRAFKELKDSIPLLREQVNQLQQKCDALSRKKETLWSASVAYFRIFENGMCGFTTRDLEYLREAIAPDVDTGSAVGLDGLIAHWKRLTQFFPDIHMQLNGLTRVGFDAVVGKIVTTITITEKSLLAAFPHLVDGNIQDGRRKQIAAKLMDQRIEMYGSVRFDWDTTNNRIIGLYTQTDMLSPMLQLVGSLENTVLVFSDALISPDGNLGVGAQQQ